jgi:zinc finger protein GLIS1/3
MPGQVLKQEPWQHGYKVLPNVAPEAQEQHFTHDAVNGSVFSASNCLSPLLQEPSPSASSFASPRQSARLSKKRAMSTSTLSSEVLDILSMIRSSPTALFSLPSGGGSISPPGQMGCYGHLSARNSSGSPVSNGGSISTKLGGLHSALDRSHALCSNLDNLAIVQDFGFPDVDQLFKEEVSCPTHHHQSQHQHHHQQGQMAPMNAGTLPSEGANMVDRPPPPPYHQAMQGHPPQQQQQQQTQQPLSEEVEETHVCRWVDCQAVFNEQDELVRHLEKQHIDQRRGDEFTCYWQGCQRRYKPFNARYKLLIHMRVHSGEKPNKCTVSPQSLHSLLL